MSRIGVVRTRLGIAAKYALEGRKPRLLVAGQRCPNSENAARVGLPDGSRGVRMIHFTHHRVRGHDDESLGFNQRSENIDVGRAYRVGPVERVGIEANLLVLIDATGSLAELEIGSDDWSDRVILSKVEKFVRAEVIAAANRPRLVAEFTASLDGRELPWQLRGADLADQPIRRALSNPIYIG